MDKPGSFRLPNAEAVSTVPNDPAAGAAEHAAVVLARSGETAMLRSDKARRKSEPSVPASVTHQICRAGNRGHVSGSIQVGQRREILCRKTAVPSVVSASPKSPRGTTRWTAAR